MRTRLAFLLALSAVPAVACLWEYGTSSRGKQVSVNDLIGEKVVQRLERPANHDLYRTQKANYERDVTTNRPIPLEFRNNYGVALLHLGETNKAVEIFQQIEREKPGLYVTAANLGTAYELAGDDPSALQWIREGIRRNPGSHGGTEWLHVRILEAKLALAKDPNWLATHSVLGIDFGTEAQPKVGGGLPAGTDGKRLIAPAVRQAVAYQLGERLQFIDPPDPIVGSLLFDWANLTFTSETLETAAALYRAALRYGPPNPDLARLRLATTEELLRQYTPRGGKKKR